jgi:hypothetical protein
MMQAVSPAVRALPDSEKPRRLRWGFLYELTAGAAHWWHVVSVQLLDKRVQ